MVQVVWAKRAETDLKALKLYLDQHSPGAASLVAQKIKKKITLLMSFPEMGRMVPEDHDPFLREIIMDRYRIIYQIISDSEIHILRVHNSSREKLSLE
jgi:plasmid stabilization system protein ParE